MKAVLLLRSPPPLKLSTISPYFNREQFLNNSQNVAQLCNELMRTLFKTLLLFPCRLGISASGNRFLRNIPVSYLDAFPAAQTHTYFPHCYLVLSVAYFQNHAWCGK